MHEAAHVPVRISFLRCHIISSLPKPPSKHEANHTTSDADHESTEYDTAELAFDTLYGASSGTYPLPPLFADASQAIRYLVVLTGRWRPDTTRVVENEPLPATQELEAADSTDVRHASECSVVPELFRVAVK